MNANGTYDILYDDGDTERGVRQSFIRRRGRSSSPRRENAARRSKHSDDDNNEDDFDGYRRGDNIEARYKGKSKWYKGSISRVNANGTYDILYDDGDTERGVRQSLIRRRGRSSSPRRENATRRSKHSDDDNDDDDFDGYRRGDNIEARYKGKSKWYKGSISRVNANGTYDILYDDGDTERGVRESLIRRRGRSSSPRRRVHRSVVSTLTKTIMITSMTLIGAIESKLVTEANPSGTLARSFGCILMTRMTSNMTMETLSGE